MEQEEVLAPRQVKKKLAEVGCNILYEAGLSLQQRIINQVEFYFSDANLKTDKFIRQAISKNRKGWFDLSQLLKFNKIKFLLKDFQNDSRKIEELNRVLNKSQLLRVNLTQVRRAVPYIDSINRDNNTVYIENLKNVPTDKLLNKLEQYTIVYKLTYNVGETWAFVDVEDPIKILNLNNHTFQDFSYSIRIMSYKQWLEYKEEYKKIKYELKRLAQKYKPRKNVEKEHNKNLESKQELLKIIKNQQDEQ